MVSVEALFGGKTRFAVLQALAEAREPVTAYQIAINKGLDPAATYRCITEFSEFGIIESVIKERNNQTFYKLSKGTGKAAAEFLRSLNQRTPGSLDLEKWLSPDIRAERMAKIVRININQFSKPVPRKPTKGKEITDVISNRTSGELSALIASSQLAFNELFDKKEDKFILKA